MTSDSGMHSRSINDLNATCPCRKYIVHEEKIYSIKLENVRVICLSNDCSNIFLELQNWMMGVLI